MKQKAFTLIELIIVLSIIVSITTFILVSLKSMREKARDARRLREINQITKALQLYYIDHGRYPHRTSPSMEGGWETSDHLPEEFMEYLAPYLSEIPLDPINERADDFHFYGPRPDNYFYAYREYEKIDTPYCPEIKGAIAILAINNLEAYVSPDLPERDMPLPLDIRIPRATCGDPGEDGICTVDEYEANQCRDWSQEFDYSIMLIE